MRKRVIVYVDGFNFYYGLKTKGWRKYYWLDLYKFFSLFLLDHQELVQVNYFSATPHHDGKQNRQSKFFQANRLNQNFKLHLGKFLKKEITCNHCDKTHETFEEKESDVRVATRMIADVVNDKCDISILVSADSDLIPPIEFIREYKPSHKIFVFFPPKRWSNDLSGLSDFFTRLDRHESKFQSSLLPLEIDNLKGYIIKCPDKWKI
ncbi:MAG: NYN domain-containing protein [Bacteroidetes bacterium]|nr:NYN domain-containing protein [Bacteroidota bacterium]